MAAIDMIISCDIFGLPWAKEFRIGKTKFRTKQKDDKITMRVNTDTKSKNTVHLPTLLCSHQINLVLTVWATLHFILLQRKVTFHTVSCTHTHTHTVWFAISLFLWGLGYEIFFNLGVLDIYHQHVLTFPLSNTEVQLIFKNMFPQIS